MDRLRLDLEVKFASDKSGVFSGYGAVFGNVDAGGDAATGDDVAIARDAGGIVRRAKQRKQFGERPVAGGALRPRKSYDFRTGIR